MRIGIDGRLWSESGVGRYIRNLVFNLGKIDQTNEYVLFLLKKNMQANTPKNFIKAEANFGWYGISEQISFPKILESYKFDLVHFPHFNVPIFYRGKYIVTIHDLIHQHFQMRRATTLDPFTYKIKQFGYNRIFNIALSKSEKIMVPSGFIKGQLIKEWNVEDSKIAITPEAVSEDIVDISKKLSQSQIASVLAKFNIKTDFIFYVGNAHVHKNIDGLIQAYLKLKLDNPNLSLVLSGNDHYFWQRIKKEYKQKDLIFTGFVSDEELVALYKKAQAFIMPSFEEGFGIPILEAMACSCPVVCSNAASLPEIGGDAALYFDPKNINDMAKKIQKILKNQKLKRSLVTKGSKRYQQFSWRKLAQKTLNLYMDCVR